MSKFLNYPQG